MKKFVAAVVAVTALSGMFVSGGSLTAGAAETTDPTFVSWSNLLPSLTSGYDPTSENECVAGKISCVDKAIKEMRRRFEPLAKACDHNAVFGLAYLRTTQTYRWAAATPGFFEDPQFVNHEDIVFASYYFDAYDNWASGSGPVPKAWQIAFDAARNKKVSGSGNVFLGMGAHVNRDLPYVLAGIGLVKPDGTSRKADHDKVNEFLNAVTNPLLAEVAARFDAGANSAAGPALLGYSTTFQMLASWREAAWRNAERLVNAPDAAARAQVERSIEDYAAGINAVLAAGTGYGLFQSSAARDAHCAANNGAAAPVAYKFGIPEPY
jgi:hypothetical protein